MPAATTSGPVRLLVATQKGAYTLTSDAERNQWTLAVPQHFGHIINHVVADPRDPARQVLLAAAKTGHLGPTVYRSLDGGATWQEATRPPSFPEREGETRAVDTVFWLTPGHATQPGVWYAGTAPAGLFRSTDNGDTWEAVAGWNDHPLYASWMENGASPGGQMVHSILIDPTDPQRMYLSVSVGGTFESTDAGGDWVPLNKGVAMDFAPPPPPEYGHDPHCVIQSQVQPNRLYQQNHCGIYRLDRPDTTWVRIGDFMPREIGDIGFPIAVHPRQPDICWVVPMDGTTVWPRTSVDGQPAVYRSADAGNSWERCDAGLPERAWLTVFRQALATDAQESVGVYFGTTSGEIWASTDEGLTWRCIAQHLPRVLAVEVL